MNKNTATIEVQVPIPYAAFETDREFHYIQAMPRVYLPMSFLVWTCGDYYWAKCESPVMRARRKYHNGRKK